MYETIVLIATILGVVINLFLLLLIYKIFRLYDELLDVQAERFEKLTKFSIDLVSEAITRVTGKKGDGNDGQT